MGEALFYAAISLALSWGIVVWLVYPLLKPHGQVKTRSGRGQQFGAYAASGVAAVTGARA